MKVQEKGAWCVCYLIRSSIHSPKVDSHSLTNSPVRNHQTIDFKTAEMPPSDAKDQ